MGVLHELGLDVEGPGDLVQWLPWPKWRSAIMIFRKSAWISVSSSLSATL